MRAANLLVVALCLAAVAAALVMVARWAGLTRRPPTATASSFDGTLDALRTLAVHADAGIVAGILVSGLGGRLVMRVLGATSGDAAQGRLTEAGENVGEITGGGTAAFLIFVGLLGGLAGGLVLLVLRRWLPARAWAAGLVLGLVLLGTFGVADPLSPDNIDFEVLEPTWLAVLLVAATALLFGVTCAALAARLDVGLRPLGRSWASNLAHVSLAFLLIVPPVGLAAGVYILARTLLAGREGSLLSRPAVWWAGTAVVVVVSAFALWQVVDAASQILRA